jgi:hypothetical protein
MNKNWFDVDKKGLANLVNRRPSKGFMVFELLQNAWDEKSSRVDAILEPVPGKSLFRLIVTDDSPEGFSNLSDAFTLFAPSKKAGNAELRGRFNLGEKMVIACCETAAIRTTTGTVTFNKDGTRKKTRERSNSGSEFSALIKMTREDFHVIDWEIDRLIPPRHISITTFNGKKLEHVEPIATFEASLPTEVANEEGDLKRTSRKCTIEIYEPKPNQPVTLYEMGIPLLETNDVFHINVCQRIPTNWERDNVSPAYLRQIRALALNKVINKIKTPDAANTTWIRDAIEHAVCEPETVASVVKARFGNKAVSYDPSDPEGSKIAVSKGFTVVPGGAFGKKTWDKIRESGVLKPAGQVTPSPKPYSRDGKPLKSIDRDKWTEEMEILATYAEIVGHDILLRNIEVNIVAESSWNFTATYGPSGILVLNKNKLGKKFFEDFPSNVEDVDRLLIHEFAHEYESDHLSSNFHESCAKLGAKLKSAVLCDLERYREYTMQ